MISLASALAAAVRVIDRVHMHAADSRPNSHPTRTAGFTHNPQIVFRI
jgi:hypothetical protein